MWSLAIHRPVVGSLVIVVLAVTVWAAVAQAGPTATPTGAVVGWGWDFFGQATPPGAVNGVSGTATDIAGGDYHSCAIQAGTGEVVCWGTDYDYDYGQATPPDAVNGVLGTATDISAIQYQSCAIQADTGNVVCWGDDSHGQATPPDTVNGVSGTATDIAAGGRHSCAIQAGTGNVVCWGSNYYGKATPPDAVNGVSGTATGIAAGIYHSCAIQADTGNVVCWGWDIFGQATPSRAVNGVSGTATDIAAGDEHSCAIQAGTGKVVCWGRDYFGQATPSRAVNGVSGTATDIVAGGRHSCAIQAGTGYVVCWGWDVYGQAMPPDAVNGASGTVTGIATGGDHTLAIVALREPTPTKTQQACVNEMNKNGEKVNKAQLRQNERCLRDFQREKFVAPMTFDACTTADEKGRVRRAWDRTIAREEKKCDTLAVPPRFAYSGWETVNPAAVDGALALTYQIFGGPPVLDDNLVTNADNKDTAKCQFEMLKRADKLENTVLKEVNKAKKKALKEETVDSDAALEAELQAVLSSSDRIKRIQDRLVRWVDRKCSVLQAAPNTIFSGGCGEGDPNLSEVEGCVIAAARCVACLKINAFDNLNLDCDQADDQDANGSCP